MHEDFIALTEGDDVSIVAMVYDGDGLLLAENHDFAEDVAPQIAASLRALADEIEAARMVH